MLNECQNAYFKAKLLIKERYSSTTAQLQKM